MVFEAVPVASGAPRQSAIMLARCKAGLHDNEACLEKLRSAFAGESEEVADDLYTAFVCNAMGVRFGRFI